MKVVFITPYPFDEAPSQRFRFEQYFRFLKDKNISYVQKPFLSNSTWEVLYNSGHSFRKVTGILSGFMRRVFLMFTLWKYDFVFIHREASPIGPPIFEFIITKILRKKTNYDFDDAIWLANTSEVNSLVSKLKWHSKVSSICRWVSSVSCGNEFLKEYASNYNSNVHLLPTSIDTELVHNKVKQYDSSKKMVIGWTGTHSTIEYLHEFIPFFHEMEKQFDFEFLVISNQNPEFDLKSFRFIKWNKETEIEDLLKIDVGIMPLKDDQWAEGKCGFKILQYMALGIIPVASPVGVNKTIIINGENGFLCDDRDQWNKVLTKLSNSSHLEGFLENVISTIAKKYSVKSNKVMFLRLFG